MPVVIFFECLDIEQKSSFMDGHLTRKYLLKFSWRRGGTGPSIKRADVSE
jgi:hypothetical protein